MSLRSASAAPRAAHTCCIWPCLAFAVTAMMGILRNVVCSASSFRISAVHSRPPILGISISITQVYCIELPLNKWNARSFSELTHEYTVQCYVRSARSNCTFSHKLERLETVVGYGHSEASLDQLSLQKTLIDDVVLCQ